MPSEPQGGTRILQAVLRLVAHTCWPVSQPSQGLHCPSLPWPLSALFLRPRSEGALRRGWEGRGGEGEVQAER